MHKNYTSDTASIVRSKVMNHQSTLRNSPPFTVEMNKQVAVPTKNSGNDSGRNSFSSVIAGVVSGACGMFVGHPFDSLKVRLQVGETLTNASFDWRTTRQLYRGVLPPASTSGVLVSINFTLYEYFKNAMAGSNLSYAQIVGVGALCSGLLTPFITNPLSVIKIQQQVASEKSAYECMQYIVKEAGWRGLYRGFLPFLTQESIGRATYFISYESAKLVIGKLKLAYGERGTINASDFVNILSWTDPRRKNAYHDNVSTRMGAAMVAGILGWISIYPCDVIKSRMQLDFDQKKYKSVTECVRKTWQQGGVRAMYRGLGYTMLRAAPVAATVLPLYEHIKDRIDELTYVGALG